MTLAGDLKYESADEERSATVLRFSPPPTPRYLDVPLIEREATGARLTVEVVSTLAAMDAIADDWRRLAGETRSPTPVFQSFAWCRAWCETYAVGNDCYTPHILVVRQDGEVVMIWPLMKTCWGPFCVLRWLSDPYGQYGDVLIAADADLTTCLDVALARVRGNGWADSIRLRHVRADSAIFPFLERHFSRAGATTQAPFLDLSAFADPAAYEARYSATQRRRRRRIKRKLAQYGPVGFEVVDARQAPAGVIEHILQCKRVWLNERNLHSKVIACADLGTFIAKLARTAHDQRVVVAMLTVGQRPVAYEIGLRFADRHHSFITAHDRAFENLSPARLNMHLSQLAALRQGVATYDLMVPGDDHKRSWSNGVCAVHDFCLPLSLKGKVHCRTWLGGVRPWARAGYLALPARLRTPFAALSARLAD